MNYEVIGHVGVDAGIIALADPCNFVPTGHWSEFCEETIPKFEKDGLVEMFCGVIVQTLHGDGAYPVEALRNKQGRITEIRIRFDDAEAYEN